jgi:hypothetical protein
MGWIQLFVLRCFCISIIHFKSKKDGSTDGYGARSMWTIAVVQRDDDSQPTKVLSNLFSPHIFNPTFDWYHHLVGHCCRHRRRVQIMMWESSTSSDSFLNSRFANRQACLSKGSAVDNYGGSKKK